GAERSGWLAARAVPEPDLAVVANPWVHPGMVKAQPYVDAADRIAEGWLDVFALRGVQAGAPPRWNRDPKTGIEAPLVFGKHLDYRDSDLVGDIKYLWEPNRHLHLVTLAQAWVLSGRKRYAETLVEHLDSWFFACPYGMGPNWASALEVGLRLVNWAAAWQLIGGAQSKLFENQDGREFRARWLRAVYQHAEFIRGWTSAHSSANNHLIGEAAGLFIAALTWPHWGRSREWLAQSKRILEREALAQNAPDGVNREQAVWYQQFVLDMLVLSLLAGKANKEWFSADFESRVEAMMDFLASVMDAGGNVPMIGDADDGIVANLGLEEDPFRPMLAVGALLFRRSDFKLKAGAASGKMSDRCRWLFSRTGGPSADELYASLDSEKTRLPLRQTFPEGGYFILGCDFDTPSEVRVVADAGALGYRSIAAHGHADALSFTLSVGGQEYLIDPGTYAYHTQARWRQYFRGTSAHNTVRIDGRDQSEQGGNFMWLAKARAACSLWLSSAEKDSFEGWHDGYMRLEDPVKHRRLIELDKKARRLLVEDTLEMADEHEVELFFHCHERCRVDAVAGGFLISRKKKALKLVLPECGEARLERGALAPMLGWVSRRFDRREQTTTIVWRAKLSGQSILRTAIVIG
ncbi:MAG: alginate lyase family protein, partial [Betaproteobacteria bacterium]